MYTGLSQKACPVFYFTTFISVRLWYEKEDVEIVVFDEFSAQT